MSRPFIYLDYNATAPAKPEVAEVVARVMTEGGNPSSVHTHGRAAKALVEEARAQVAALAGAEPKSVTFTGSGTEANNLVFTGAVKANKVGRLLISTTEHESVAKTAAASGLALEELPVDRFGAIDAEALGERLEGSSEKALVSVMLANNETGRIQDISQLAAIAHEAQALFHCDAVQAAGKIPLDMTALDADFMTLSAHKFGGPQGVGALLRRPSIDVAAMILGGGQELGRRSGTENLAGIVGMGLAAELAVRDMATMSSLAKWRDDMESQIGAYAPEALVVCQESQRLPNTSLISLPGVLSETQVMTLDLAGFGVSAGSACSSGKVAASHTLKAMGLGDEIASSAIRVSLGWKTTQEDVKAFTQGWMTMRDRLSPQARTEVA
ncbi:MAG: cysteine desulfurase [Alphaproteobacteria bacterium]|nr:MAG: cysteine desulfurase [Alphaproteobacteria bacterium]